MVTNRTVSTLKTVEQIRARINQIRFRSKAKMFSIQTTAKIPAAARVAHIQEDILIRRLVPIKWPKSSIMRMVGNTMSHFFPSKFHILPRANIQTSRIRNSILRKIGLVACYKRVRISNLAKISQKIKTSTRLGLRRKMPRTLLRIKI